MSKLPPEFFYLFVCSELAGLCCSRPAGGRGMKLGKTKDVESFVDQLKSEGERKFYKCSESEHLGSKCYNEIYITY